MAISWGTKIFFLYTGFILLIGTLVWKTTQTKFDLVSEDYYEQEISFQQKLDARKASAALSSKPVVSFTEASILVFFPPEFSERNFLADIKLYNPANAAQDRSFDKMQVQAGKLELPREQVPPSRYIAKISWQSDGKAYYEELPLNLSGR